MWRSCLDVRLPCASSPISVTNRCVLPAHLGLSVISCSFFANNLQLFGCALLSCSSHELCFPEVFFFFLAYTSGQPCLNLVNNVPVNSGRLGSSDTIWKRNRGFPHVGRKSGEGLVLSISCHPKSMLQYHGLGRVKF